MKRSAWDLKKVRAAPKVPKQEFVIDGWVMDVGSIWGSKWIKSHLQVKVENKSTKKFQDLRASQVDEPNHQRQTRRKISSTKLRSELRRVNHTNS